MMSTKIGTFDKKGLQNNNFELIEGIRSWDQNFTGGAHKRNVICWVSQLQFYKLSKLGTVNKGRRF
eukprot:Awhi_evm1s9274